MSADIVDDLHAAEDMSGLMAVHLSELLAVDVFAPVMGEELTSTTNLCRALWDEYCRPSCGAQGDPDSEACDDAFCGCPCGHVR